MKFLIISPYYPPWQTVGGLRAALMAKHLVRKGHRCAVITLATESLPRIDPEFVPFENGVHEFRVAPGWVVPYTLKSANGRPPGFMHKLLRKFTTYWKLDDWYWWALKAANAYIQKPFFKPDVVFSSALPFASHVAGRILAHHFQALWIADYRDLWFGQPHMQVSHRERQRRSHMQKQILARAHLITCVSDAMMTFMSDELNAKIPIQTWMNAFDDDHCYSTCDGRLLGHQLKFLYTGRLYEGYRDFQVFFKALATLRNRECDLSLISVGYAGPDGQLFFRHAEKYQLGDLVKDLGMLPRKKALELQRQADILLLSIGTGRDDEAMVLTGKVFEYLAARKPIFALGNTKGDLGRLLKQTRAGYIYRPDQLEEITSKLAEWFMAFSKTGTVPYEGVDEEIQKHSWSNRVDELVAIIQDLRNGRA